MTRLFLLALGLTLSACDPPPPSAYLVRAANPSANPSPLRVDDATAGTRDYSPAEPGDWEKINRAVAPHGEQK